MRIGSADRVVTGFDQIFFENFEEFISDDKAVKTGKGMSPPYHHFFFTIDLP